MDGSELGAGVGAILLRRRCPPNVGAGVGAAVVMVLLVLSVGLAVVVAE